MYHVVVISTEVYIIMWNRFCVSLTYCLWHFLHSDHIYRPVDDCSIYLIAGIFHGELIFVVECTKIKSVIN